MRVSVVIPAYNGEKNLETCLGALSRAVSFATLESGSSKSTHQSPATNHQELRCEIIVVDDGSTDRTAEIARAAGVRLVSQAHRGAAAARNLGVREALGEIVLFTDSDCIVAPDWVEKLSVPLILNQAPTTSHQPLTPNHHIVGTVGRCVSDQRHWVAALIQTELEERYFNMSHHERIDFLNTGNCAFRRELLLEHPFDESFRWLEDVELSFRLAHEGYEMIFVEDARVEHPHPEKFTSYAKRKFRYASCAPEIYHRFPEKTFSDSRTPLNRRLQLFFIGLAGLGFIGWTLKIVAAQFLTGSWLSSVGWFFLWVGLICLVLSLLSTAPVTMRALKRSIVLGLLAPFFVTGGNLAFVAGALRGFLFHKSEPS